MKGIADISRWAATPLTMCGLVFLVWGAFAPMLGHDFVNYDDPVYVTENAFIRGGLSREGISWALTAFYDGNWFPLTWFSHMLDITLFGFQAGGHHLTSLLLHAVNTLLLFIVFRHMTGRPAASAMVAALFAIHPLHVEPVAWIAQRRELLATSFGLLAIGAYSRHRQNPKIGLYLAVVIFFFLSLASKPTWVTLPALLILLDIWPLRRLVLGQEGAIGKLRELVAEKAPLFVLSLLSALLILFTQYRDGAVRSIEDFSVLERAGNAVFAYGQYLTKTLWPVRLAVYYPHPGSSLSAWQIGASAFFLLLVTGVVIRRFSRQPYLAVGWFWYLISLLPVIGLVQIGGAAMAGRYTYLPLTGIFFAAIWGAWDVLRSFRAAPALLSAGGLLLVIVLAVAARGQVAYWKDSITLFERSLAVTGPNPVALINLGDAYEKVGRPGKAIELYRQVLQLSPEHPLAMFNLGEALWKSGNPAEAEKFYRKTLSVNPGHTGAANNLGAMLARQKRYQEALSHYQALLAAGGGTANVHGNMGNLLALMGRRSEAVRHFQRAISLAPEDALAHCNYGIVLEEAGRIEEAITHYSEAIRLDPNMTVPYCRVASLLAKRGHSKRARAFVEMARQRDSSACTGGR